MLHKTAGSTVTAPPAKTSPTTACPATTTDALADLLIAQLKAHVSGPQRSQPFFMCLSVQPPHDPYVAPEEFMRRHTPGQVTLRPNVPAVPRVLECARRQLAGYYAMIENLDWNLGRIRQALSDLRLADSTHILFFSDHGDMLGGHGLYGKGNMLEGSARVPLLIRLPGQRQQRFIRPPVSQIDLMPTLLDVLGQPIPEGLHGQSLRPVLEGQADVSARDVFIEWIPGPADGTTADLTSPKSEQIRTVVTADGWKLNVSSIGDHELYDLSHDPLELRNLYHAPQQQSRINDLRQRIAAWQRRVRDTRWPGAL